MSSNNVLSTFLQQLAGQLPVLLAYLVGLVLALVFWGRHPKVCLLTCIATAVLLGVSLVTTYLQIYLSRTMMSSGTSSRQYAQAMQTLFLVANVVRAGGFTVLLMAVFTGRNLESSHGFQVMPPAIPPTTPPAGGGPTWRRPG